MAYNFVSPDRDQSFLLPPDLREWLPEEHLVWFVIDVVAQLDLSGFRASYRADGHGRAAYDPAMMVGLLLYGYCLGVRSSRALERRCAEDVAFRVLSANLAPDHVTIARFRRRHEDALAQVLVESLRLCAEAGLVHLGAVALDGTRIGADAAFDSNRTLEELDAEVTRMLAEAEAADRADEDPGGDDHQLPPALRGASAWPACKSPVSVWPTRQPSANRPMRSGPRRSRSPASCGDSRCEKSSGAAGRPPDPRPKPT